jgi:hypothetical protein
VAESEANAELLMNFIAMHAAMLPDVPEPSTFVMLAAAAALLPMSRRRVRARR